jgi:hypothetical protein
MPNGSGITRMNLLLSRLDEQQRRWYVALESKRLGHGGDTRLAEITGMGVRAPGLAWQGA